MRQIENSEGHDDHKEPKVKLLAANSVWVEGAIGQDYIDMCKNDFLSEVHNLSSADAINKWVSDKTEGLIQKILNDQVISYDLSIMQYLCILLHPCIPASFASLHPCIPLHPCAPASLRPCIPASPCIPARHHIPSRLHIYDEHVAHNNCLLCRSNAMYKRVRGLRLDFVLCDQSCGLGVANGVWNTPPLALRTMRCSFANIDAAKK